ncbi:hypothetical protein CXG50_10590 [Pseudomonas plecoglossicida]|uniref:Uncharacterized protein n=1 Tax=Pseudomonas plecoglossicida TaxID=70775 RepID=A0ABX4U551_PSEDL|nr:hypothetical protein CSW00_01595 [Pseudomonas sp. MR 02]PLP88089.1 hypothetical protein CX682_21430 [Pseudomonas sp. FFUP_PS_41]PLU88835.1 hypothetical protein CXG44_03780 [Pseudomonas plecoglossicida]QKK98805.1 hypothetical protein GEV38_23805 [Pseudomonas sp. 13159349]TXI01932.1 MAG: hypothetical protein E6Q70_19320 [Pseudomonas monteilii]GJB79106.1 hypothetical protein KAM380_035710 [Aeromonas caviae]
MQPTASQDSNQNEFDTPLTRGVPPKRNSVKISKHPQEGCAKRVLGNGRNGRLFTDQYLKAAGFGGYK